MQNVPKAMGSSKEWQPAASFPLTDQIEITVDFE